MKGNKKLLIVAALILLITVSFTTYAIYRESTTVEGTIETAAWSVKIKKAGASGEGTAFASANLTFTNDDIVWTQNPGRNGKIAPGATGTISFDVDATGSEVDVYVTAEIDESQLDLPDGFTIALDSNGARKITYSSSEDMVETIEISVVWEGELSDTASKDESDLGFKNQTVRVPVIVTARQGVASEE